jgi:hypothetical protein
MWQAYPAGLGEPLNVILSGNSDPDVLNSGKYFLTYIASLGESGDVTATISKFVAGFSGTCLGQIPANQQRANLGDGKGQYNETAVMRWNYGDVCNSPFQCRKLKLWQYNFGTCKETVDGGNHFRYWVQDGQEAKSGAVFMAVSYEENLSNGHNISPNGTFRPRFQLAG